MNKVLALALLALRNAMRSRLVFLLLLLLVAAVVGLPLTVRGDGTVAGQVQILVRYTLGAVLWILALTSVWAGCAAVSLEIQSRRLHLVATKPVHAFQVWLGAWLGLLALNAVLLLLGGFASWLLLHRSLRERMKEANARAELEQHILVARRLIPAQPVDVEAAAQRRYRDLQAQGTLPADRPASATIEAIRQVLLQQAFMVPPDGQHRWSFPAPARLPPGRPLLFRFRYASSQMGPERITGLWRVQRGMRGRAREQITEAAALSPQTFQVPPEGLDGEGPLYVDFINRHPDPRTILFGPADGLELLVYEGRFGPNYARTLLILWTQLAFFSAVGVTAGCLFSMPVAAFLSLFVLFIAQAAGAIQSLAGRPAYYVYGHGTKAAGPLLHLMLKLAYGGLYSFVRPMRLPPVLDAVSTGGLVPWTEVGHLLLTQGLLISLMLGAAAATVLRRRELALAE